MAELSAIPVYRDRGIYQPGPIGLPLPRGPLVGAVLIDEDALIFEAYAYNSRPMLLGQTRSLRDAINLFQQRKGPPRPPSKRFDRR